MDPITAKDSYNFKCGDLDIDGYDSLLVSAGFKIEYIASIGDYQGDLFFLLSKDGLYYYAQTGYGSCSGCDAFLAMNTVKEMEDLRKSLIPTSCRNKENMISWLENHDWAGDYCPEAKIEFAIPAIKKLKESK